MVIWVPGLQCGPQLVEAHPGRAPWWLRCAGCGRQKR